MFMKRRIRSALLVGMKLSQPVKQLAKHGGNIYKLSFCNNLVISVGPTFPFLASVWDGCGPPIAAAIGLSPWIGDAGAILPPVVLLVAAR